VADELAPYRWKERFTMTPPEGWRVRSERTFSNPIDVSKMLLLEPVDEGLDATMAVTFIELPDVARNGLPLTTRQLTDEYARAFFKKLDLRVAAQSELWACDLEGVAAGVGMEVVLVNPLDTSVELGHLLACSGILTDQGQMVVVMLWYPVASRPRATALEVNFRTLLSKTGFLTEQD